MIKKILLIFLATILITSATSEVNYPVVTKYVNDYAGIFSPDETQQIQALAQKIDQESTVEVAVVTMKSLDGEEIQPYATELFKRAGIGKPDKDNGLLILIICCNKEDRGYRFEVGYGLESTITDSMKVPIGDRIIVPNFKQEKYGKGVYESMLVVEGLVTNNSEVVSQYAPNKLGGGAGTTPGSALVIVFGVIIIGAIIFSAMTSDTVTSRHSRDYSYSGKRTHYRGHYSPSTGNSYRDDDDYGSHRSNESTSSYSGGGSGGGGFGGGW